ncbi:MAG: DUF5723 family protein [Muribaculaceae bacterium]
MMRLKSILLVVAIAMAAIANAQQTSSGYFVDGYLYRFKMNPAIGNDKGYFATPALGNLNVAERGSVPLTSFIYDVNGEATTFLNKSLSSSEVLGNFEDNNKLGMNLDLQVLSFGFKGFHGYNTISVNARTNVSVAMPKDLIKMMKEGVGNSSYDITGAGAHVNAYAEVALNHSHQINKNLRIGATLKLLSGVARVDADFQKAQMRLNGDRWDIVSNATIEANIKNLSFKYATNEETGHKYVDGFDYDKFGLNGFGAAVDLGAVYTLNDDWQFSASLLDLGFIRWSNSCMASTNGDMSITAPREDFDVQTVEGDMDDEWDQIGDMLTSLYELEDMGETGGHTRSLATTFNVGVEYKLPVYRKLSFGLLNTTRMQSDFNWTEFRLSANIAPCRLFSMGANVATGTFGTGFGFIMNLRLLSFNLYAGMDHAFTSLNNQHLPSGKATSATVGINWAF